MAALGPGRDEPSMGAASSAFNLLRGFSTDGGDAVARSLELRKEARADAIALARSMPLPVKARSLTGAEKAALKRLIIPVFMGVYAVLALFAVAILASDSGAFARQQLLIAVPVIAVIGALLWLGVRRIAGSGYVDPHMMVEVGEGGVTVRSPGRIDEIAYADAEVSFWAPSMRGRSHFLGLVLQSPIGPLRLDDRWFKPGRTAAAAIAGRMEELGALQGGG
jgi:hypothetical protein